MPNGKRINKKDFASAIENLGGTCRGFDNTKSLNKSVTDYLVIGKDDWEKWGKQDLIKKHNENPSNKPILIITQEKCESFIDIYNSGNKLN